MTGYEGEEHLSTLSVAEIKLSGIVALATDAIISVDDRHLITLFNAAAERMFGYECGDVLGQPLECLLPEASRAVHHGHLEQFRAVAPDSRQMGARGQIWGRRRSGELFPAEASISKLQLGDAMHFTAVVRDVTEQRRIDREREELLRRETEARQAAEAAERRVVFLSDATDILHSSLAYERTFETLLRLIVPELADFATIDVVDEMGIFRRLHVVHADPTKQALADRLRAYPRDQQRYLSSNALTSSGDASLTDDVTDELLAAAAEDEEHLEILRALAPASYMVVPLRARDRVLGALLLARGATGAHYSDADLQLATQLAHRAASALDNARLYNEAQRAIGARDNVMAIVSHDLRSPFSVISMCIASVLMDEAGDVTRTRDAMRTAKASLEWADRLIRDLLDVAAMDAGGLSLTRRLEDPVLIVSRAVHLHSALAAERSITLRAELPEHLPLVNVDEERIGQALGNLVTNAIKFAPVESVVRVGAVQERDSVRIFVSDSGPGVPANDVPHVFERFWKARRTSTVRGTGLGLAIVRGIVEAHAGRAWVTLNPAGGAIFHIALPAASGDTRGDD